MNTASGMKWHIPVIPATWEAEIGGAPFQTSPGKVNMTLYLKIQTKSKKDCGYGSSGRALSSIPPQYL
jgi:hypothetical protein